MVGTTHNKIIEEKLEELYKSFQMKHSCHHACESTFNPNFVFEEEFKACQSYIDEICSRFEREELQKVDTVVDIGSGFGHNALMLAKRFKKVIGVEPDPLCIEISNTKKPLYGVSNVKFVKGFSEKLPLEDKSADLIFMNQTLEHVSSLEETFSEITRVLKKGGLLYIACPNYFWIFEGHYALPMLPLMPKRLFRLWARLWGRDPYFINGINYLTPRRFKKLAKKYGLIITKNVSKEMLRDVFLGKRPLAERYRFLSWFFLSFHSRFSQRFVVPSLVDFISWVGFYPMIAVVVEKE